MTNITPPTTTSERRETILDAALIEFNANGVAGTSIDEIRRRSGASVGSIYHLFGGKDGIAGALYLEGLRDYQDGFLAALGEAASTQEGIELGVRYHLEWIATHPDLARFLLLGRDASVVVATEKPLLELNRGFFTAVSRWMRPAVQCGEVRATGPELLTALWVGPSQELARHWLAGRGRFSLTDATDTLAQAAWKSLSLEA